MAGIPFAYTLFKRAQTTRYVYIIQGRVLEMGSPTTYSILSHSLDEKKEASSQA